MQFYLFCSQCVIFRKKKQRKESNEKRKGNGERRGKGGKKEGKKGGIKWRDRREEDGEWEEREKEEGEHQQVSGPLLK